eukprot:Opistho-1_new@58730
MRRTQSTRQPLFFLFFTMSAARVAVSNTSRTFSFVLAEHSMYFVACTHSAFLRPSCSVTGACFIFASSFIVLGSLRRSFLQPTSTNGTLGQKWRTSGTHFSLMFSSESGLSIAKHMRTTFVSGYDSGRRRS